MPERSRKPGSKKGQPKPVKRALDAQFPFRFAEAMGKRKVPELARKVGCSRAVLGKYLNGESTTIEAILLAEICGELRVSPIWLVKGAGTKTGLTPDEDILLSRYRNSKDDEKELMLKVSEKMLQAEEHQ